MNVFVPSVYKVEALKSFLLYVLVYVESVVEDLLYATDNPAPLGVEELAKILLLSVRVGEVEAEIALDPNRAPELKAATLIEL